MIDKRLYKDMVNKREAFRDAFLDLNEKMAKFFIKWGFKEDEIRVHIDEYDFVSISVPHDLNEEIVDAFETIFNVERTVRVQETVTDYTVPGTSTVVIYRHSFVPMHLYDSLDGVDADVATEDK